MLIHAHTSAGVYPPYINVSSLNPTSNHVRVTVRSPAGEDGSCGTVSHIDLTRQEYMAMLKAQIDEALT